MADAGVGSGPFEGFGRKVDAGLGGVGPRVEGEVRRVIAYLNDTVVPEVRRESSGALRSAAQQLSRLAEVLERGTGVKQERGTGTEQERNPGPGA